jgi:hypothetical protein
MFMLYLEYKANLMFNNPKSLGVPDDTEIPGILIGLEMPNAFVRWDAEQGKWSSFTSSRLPCNFIYFGAPPRW